MISLKYQHCECVHFVESDYRSSSSSGCYQWNNHPLSKRGCFMASRTFPFPMFRDTRFLKRHPNPVTQSNTRTTFIPNAYSSHEACSWHTAFSWTCLLNILSLHSCRHQKLLSNTTQYHLVSKCVANVTTSLLLAPCPGRHWGRLRVRPRLIRRGRVSSAR